MDEKKKLAYSEDNFFSKYSLFSIKLEKYSSNHSDVTLTMHIYTDSL